MDNQDCNQFKCSSIKVQSFGPLNLLQTHSNSNEFTFIWNPFVIIVYRNYEFKCPHLTVTADFIIANVLATRNVIVCVDTNGIVHTLPLKMKSNVNNNHISISFKPRHEGVLKIVSCDDNYSVSILKEHGNIFLSVNKISTDYKIVNKWSLMNCISIAAQEINAEMCLMTVCVIDDYNKDKIAKIFQIESNKIDLNSVFIMYSLNRKLVYGSIVNPKSVELSHVILYSSPLTISSIEINDSKSLNIIIVLRFGSVVSLLYNLSSDQMENELIPLNASVHNFLIVSKNKFIYTDGSALWYTQKKENMQNQINHHKINITQPRNFILVSTNILCITYSNIIYNFNLEMSDIFRNDTSDKYISIPRDMSEAKDIIEEIGNEMIQNEDILKRIKEESSKSTLIALCSKSQLLKDHLLSSIKIFETYESVKNEITDVTLMQPIHNYFEDNIFIIMAKFEISSEFKHKFNDINHALRKEICFHLNISIENANNSKIHSTNLPLNSSLINPIQMLFALNNCSDNLPLRVNLRIVSPLCGALNKNDKFWCVLHSNHLDISVGHCLMIKLKNNTKRTLTESIFNLARTNCKTIFNIQVPEKVDNLKSYSSYLILPDDYMQSLSSPISYEKYLSEANAEYLAKKFECLNGLKSKTIYVHSCDKEFCLRIINEDDDCVKLQITSANANHVFDMRNFFANILYGTSDTHLLIPQVLYSRIENLRRKVKMAPHDGTSLEEIAENFHKNIIGCLPL